MVKIANIELGEFPLLLAPMEDVSDPPFRVLCKKYGADLMYTEFISSEGLIRDAHKSIQKLDFYPEERPLGIQIFGGELESMLISADVVTESNPDILDINYGCPVKKVTCKGAGAGILQDIPKMISLTEAIVKRTHLPVTVKTRLGWDDNSKHIVDVAERLQDIGIQGISIHGRTRAQMYKGEADWSLIREVRENPRMKIPVFGNGDINTPEDVVFKRNEFGVDGVMIGRAAIGNPWIFREIKHFMKTGEKLEAPTVGEKVEACKEHLLKSIDWKGERLGIFEMRRHYTNYFRGLDGIKEHRSKLVTISEVDGLFYELDTILEKYGSLTRAQTA